MTLTVESQDLVSAIRRIKLPGAHGASAVLLRTENGALTGAVDNRDVKVTVTCPILDGELPSVHFPYDTVFSVLKTYPAGPIRMSMDDDGRLHLKAGRKRSSFFVMNPEAFPRRPRFQANVTLSLEERWGAFSRVTGAVHDDEEKGGWVANVILRDGYVYATDRYRIHRSPLFGAPVVPVCIPGSVITTILKAKCNITRLSWNKDRFQMEANDMVWEGHLGNPTEVPPSLASFYQPPIAASFTVDRKELIRVLHDVMGLRIDSGTYKEVAAFTFEDGMVTVGRAGADVGDTAEDLEVTTKGNISPTGFNAHNLRDTLSLLEGDTVTIGSQGDPTKPWRIEDSQLEVGIMPVKLGL